MKSKILIVDDEVQALEMLAEIFTTNGFIAEKALDGKIALKRIRESAPDIVISDLFMPNMNGIELLDAVSKEFPEISFILVTAHGSVETAVKAMQIGAKDYIMKPLRLEEILTKVRNLQRLRDLEAENKSLKKQLNQQYNFDNIIGKNTQMLELFEQIKAIANAPTTILIRGENGTGKELVARAIHYNSDRAGKPYVTVNSAVLTDNLLESELFGHVKGAYSGAHRDREGRFEIANTGTIFLDEIGDISPAMQTKLLRVIEHKEFQRLGSNETYKVDVRILAATNRNLEEAIENGDFRRDLYYRLNTLELEIPPLRDRLDDIPLLSLYFIEKYNKLYNKNIAGIMDDAMELLHNHIWQGNVRELENLIERAILLSKSEMLGIKDFAPIAKAVKPTVKNDEVFLDGSKNLSQIIDEYEIAVILKALKKFNNNRKRTAEYLGVNRSTLMSKIKKYNLNEFIEG